MKTLSNVSLKGATILSHNQLKLVRGGAWVVVEHIKTGYNHFGSMDECQVIGHCAADQNQNFWSIKYCKDTRTASTATSELSSSYNGVRFECF